MNFEISKLPEREAKPRNAGLTMVMDKGMSLREVEDFISVSGEYTDLLKLGFGTSYVTPHLKQKIELYHKANIPVYFGGTLFEAFVIRGQIDDYIRLLEKYKITHCEISDGSIDIPEEEKCNYIHRLSKYAIVLSEVGSKDAEKIIPPYKWIAMMQAKFRPVYGK